MSGYADDFSKSNNALQAECSGLFPASVLARRIGVNPGAIRALMRHSEWHHTSKFYNSVNYYSEESALEIIDQLKAWKEPAKDLNVFENCTGTYLEWSGTRSHPHAMEIQFGPCRVTQKGKWFTLELSNGLIRKNADTRGFQLKDGNGRRLTFN